MYTGATPRKHTLSQGESGQRLMCACVLRPGGGLVHPCWREEGFLRELSSDCRTQMVMECGGRGV